MIAIMFPVVSFCTFIADSDLLVRKPCFVNKEHTTDSLLILS